jgi:hypothetical protein
MNDSVEILNFLEWTGHLEYPNGVKQTLPDGPFHTAIRSVEALKAVASFQAFEAEQLDRLCLKMHGRAARIDGEIGPATEALMDIPRCGHPDYGLDVQAATGSGSWPNCHGIGDFHAAKVFVNVDQIPDFLQPYWNEVFARCQASYMDIGHKWILTEDEGEANTTVSFVRPNGQWIGLAILGQQETCTSQIWAKFDHGYQPSNIVSEWTTLLEHELGHNAGLSHSRGGIMNPSIVQGLAPTWRGDPSEPILVNYFGGIPIEAPPISGEYYTHQGFKSNLGRTIWVQLPVPIPVERG